MKLGDRGVTVDVKVRDVQLYAARDGLSGQAGERRFNELGLIVVAPGQGVSPLDGPVDGISDPVPELRLASGILGFGEQGDPVISYRGHDSLPLLVSYLADFQRYSAKVRWPRPAAVSPPWASASQSVMRRMRPVAPQKPSDCSLSMHHTRCTCASMSVTPSAASTSSVTSRTNALRRCSLSGPVMPGKPCGTVRKTR